MSTDRLDRLIRHDEQRARQRLHNMRWWWIGYAVWWVGVFALGADARPGWLWAVLIALFLFNVVVLVFLHRVRIRHHAYAYETLHRFDRPGL